MLLATLPRLARHAAARRRHRRRRLAIVAAVLHLGAAWLTALGIWNLIVFFGLLLGASVLAGVPIGFAFGLATVA